MNETLHELEWDISIRAMLQTRCYRRTFPTELNWHVACASLHLINMETVGETRKLHVPHLPHVQMKTIPHDES